MKTLAAAVRRDLLPFAVFAVAALSLALLPYVSHATITHLNVYNVLQTFADYGLLALAVGLTMILAEYDLSTASLYGLAGMVAVLTGTHTPAYGVLLALAVGLGGGLVQGTIITRLRLAAVPVTLGGFIVYLGITYVISHNNDVTYSRITVGLRLDEPVALSDVEQALDRQEVARLQRLGLAEQHADGLTLTARGRFLGDAVTAAMLR